MIGCAGIQIDKPDNARPGPIAISRYEMYNGKPYGLLWVTPESHWIIGSASRTGPQQCQPWDGRRKGDAVVTFEFNPAGGGRFRDHDRQQPHRPMAVVLDDKIINIATIQSRNNDRGQIDGGQKASVPANSNT